MKVCRYQCPAIFDIVAADYLQAVDLADKVLELEIRITILVIRYSSSENPLGPTLGCGCSEATMSVHAIMRSTAHRAIFPAPSFAPAPSLGLGSRVLQTRSFRLASTNNTTWSLQSPARKPTKARQGIQNPSFSTSAATMSAANFLSAIQHRRTHYVLNDKSPVSDDRIEEILKTTVQAVPSSFNAQSVRYVVLLKDQHKKFWDIVLKLLQPHIKEATREGTEKRLAGFRAA